MNKFVCIPFFLLSLVAHAQEEQSTESPQKAEAMAPVVIQDEVAETSVSTPSLSSRISEEKKKMMDHTDVIRVLRAAPGVYAQEEDALGLRPNIGLRGVYPHRSRKLSFYEDGVLVGPAPYSAPAAYYNPSMTKIDRLEVHRGFHAVTDGPNSIGGAVHYFTKEIPPESVSSIDISAGAFNTRKLNTWHGNQMGLWGYLIQFAQVDSDGFKELRSGEPVGVTKRDVVSKVRYTFPSGQQELELKIGYADEASHETYLGLNQDDFASDYTQRYAASERDLMKWEQNQILLTYSHEINTENKVAVRLYNQNFHRNWYRFSGFKDTSVDVSEILRDPTGANEVYMDILRGDQDSSVLGAGGDLAIAGNDRTYLSQGLSLQWNGQFSGEAWNSRTKAEVLLHRDWIDRNHTQDNYEMLGGRMKRNADPQLVTADNRDESQALSLRLVEEIQWRRWTWALAVRQENVRYKTVDDKAMTESDESESAFVPGTGLSYEITPQWVALVGVSRGVTLVGPRKGANEEPELSTTYELGLRWNSFLKGEVIGFYTDYENIKGVCSFASGCTNPNELEKGFNGGRAEVKGIEAVIEVEPQWKGWNFPSSISYTLLETQFKDDFDSTNSEWGIGTIRSGDPLPYVPNSQYQISLGAQRGRFAQEAIIGWVGSSYDQSVQTDRRTIDSYGWIDWAARYKYSDSQQVSLKVDNLTDNKYLVSYRPFGARPGKPRAFMIGWSGQF